MRVAADRRRRQKWLALAAPLLFAAYPALQITAHNIEHVGPPAALRPLIISLALALILFFGARLLGWEQVRASLGAVLVVIVVLSYGHLYQALKAAHPLLASLVRHRFLLPLVLLLLAAGLWGLARLRRAPESAVAILVLAAGTALIQPLLVLAANGWSSLQPAPRPFADELACHQLDSRDRPDIYLIVLDAYERNDVLLQAHGYDNGPFLSELESLGFTVGYGSLSNYRYTAPSIASMLNMAYVQDFPEPAHSSWTALSRTLRHPRIRSELECLGYQVIAFDSGIEWTIWPDADRYVSQDPTWLHRSGILGPISRVDGILLERSLLLAGLDGLQTAGGGSLPAWLDPTQEHVSRIHFTLAQLGAIAEGPSPKFVYAHLISPHPPMVLGQPQAQAGTAAFERAFAGEPGEALGEYAAQVDYLNGLVLDALRQIVADSAESPIIILTGDHGWSDRSPEQKLSILHAYRLPGPGAAAFYPTITPVNAFRLVLSAYFGADLELLPDRSFYSEGRDLLNFEPVENTWRTGQGE